MQMRLEMWKVELRVAIVENKSRSTLFKKLAWRILCRLLTLRLEYQVSENVYLRARYP